MILYFTLSGSSSLVEISSLFASLTMQDKVAKLLLSFTHGGELVREVSGIFDAQTLKAQEKAWQKVGV